MGIKTNDLKAEALESDIWKNNYNKNGQEKNIVQYNRKIPGRRKNDYIHQAIQDTLFNELPFAVFYLDLNLRYISANQIYTDFFGLSPKEIKGKSINDLLPADQAKNLQKNYSIVLKTGNKLTNVCQWLTNAYGQNLYLSMTIVPFFDEEEHISGLIGTHNVIGHSFETSLINHNLLRENRSLTQKLFNIQEEERRKLARDLHDELGQWLIAIQSEIYEARITAGKNTSLQSNFKAVQEYIQNMHKIIRSMLHRLRPALLDSLGLTNCLRKHEKDWRDRHPEIDYELIINDSFNNIDESISITVYRLIQESLNNICRHANASKVQIQLDRRQSEHSNLEYLWLKIKDNGTGFDINSKTKGYGLLGMRERIIATDGDFIVYSTPGKGTVILAKLPLEPAEARLQ